METIEQLYEIIRNEAGKDPETKKVMERVFPAVFESGVYCKIGTTFKRKEYPDNDYALIKWNGEVRILNITCNSFWDSKRNLKVSKLKDPEGKTLTISEFKELSGFETLDTFVFPSILKPGTILERLLAKEPATYEGMRIMSVIDQGVTLSDMPYNEDKPGNIKIVSLMYWDTNVGPEYTTLDEITLNVCYENGTLKFTESDKPVASVSTGLDRLLSCKKVVEEEEANIGRNLDLAKATLQPITEGRVILERLLAKEPATYYNLEIAEVIYHEGKRMQDTCNTSLFYITEDGNILHTWTTEEQLNQNFKDGNLKFTVTSDKGCSDM